MTRRLLAAAFLLPALAACSSTPPPAAAPAPATTSTAPAQAATTTAAPPATTDPDTAATVAMCRAFDTGIADLAALTAQLTTGHLTTSPLPAITIGKADIAIRAAAASGPAKSHTSTDMVTFAVAAEALSKKITAGLATGHVNVGNEYADVKTDWAYIDADCKRNGYVIAHVIG